MGVRLQRKEEVDREGQQRRKRDCGHRQVLRPDRLPNQSICEGQGPRPIGFESRIKGIAIEEAYRLITVREGDRVEKIPLVQAILRKIGVNAANGNSRAQKTILNLVLGAEADRSAAAAEILRAAVEGKEYWAAIFAEYDRRGIDRPEPIPHPDDVVIDYKTGEVRINGPL
jgi:hypothetical protein